MCLSRVFTDAEMEEWLADKPEVIKVWKVAKVISCGAYMAPFRVSFYKGGLNSVNKAFIEVQDYSKYKVQDNYKYKVKDNCRYYAGFHFLSKQSKRYFGGYTGRMFYTWIKCLVKKEWITAIGKEGNQTVIVASQAVFPHYPEREARMEDMPMDWDSTTDSETGPVLVRV